MIKRIIFFAGFIGLFLIPNALFAIDVNNAGDLLKQTVKPTGVSEETLSSGAGKLIQRILASLSIIFLVLTVYGGFLWMTARENDQMAEKAKNILVGAIVGMVITIGAYGISTFIVDRLASEAAGNGSQVQANDSTPQGCCLDRTNVGWACRVTTKNDCEAQGKVCAPGDDYCQPNHYSFEQGVLDVDICVSRCDVKNQ